MGCARMELSLSVNHLYYTANDKKLKRFNLFVLMFFEILRIFKFTQKTLAFYYLIYFLIIMNFIEKLFITIIFQNVMITLDQYFFSLQNGYQLNQIFLAMKQRYIAQNINDIIIGNLFIPMLDDVIIHFIHSGKWPFIEV